MNNMGKLSLKNDYLYKITLSENYFQYMQQLSILIIDWKKAERQNEGEKEDKVDDIDDTDKKRDEVDDIDENVDKFNLEMSQKLFELCLDIHTKQDKPLAYLLFVTNNIQYLIVRDKKTAYSITNYINSLIIPQFDDIINKLLSKSNLMISINFFKILPPPTIIFDIDGDYSEIHCLPIDKLIYDNNFIIESPFAIVSDNMNMIREICPSVDSDKISVIHSEEYFLGFSIGAIYWIFNIEKAIPYIRDNPTIKWFYLKYYLTSPVFKKRSYKVSANILEYAKHKDFHTICSSLKDNYYVDDDSKLSCANPEVKSFIDANFENNVMTENIDKYKSNKFITSKPIANKGTIVGIYNSSNQGKKEYDLEYWLFRDESTHHNYPDKGLKAKTKEVFTLNPELSFYFREFFFEDYMDNLLNELKQENEIIDVISNVKFGNREVDFFIFTKNKKIIKIEAKTSLTKFNIDSQKIKDEKNIKFDEQLNIIDSYILIGYKHDGNCKESYHYFIDNETGDDLLFELPLNNSSNKKSLTCMSFSEYGKLKENIIKAIQ